MIAQDKLQARIASLMKAKVAEDERHATEKSNEQGPAQEEIFKRHAEELRALEAKLTAKHQEELKSALEKAQQEKSAPTLGGDQDIQKADVDSAIAELQTKHAEEISAAVERGRMESAAKGKLKDSQLVRAQKRVKELEAQILGLMPAGSGSVAGSSTGPVAGPSTASAIAPNPAQPLPSSSAPNPSATSEASANASTVLPRKPSVASMPPTGPARGVARVAVRGRGIQRPLGGAVGLGRGTPTKPAEAAPAVGMQIMGAATKRPLDDLSEDSLAKRLKPAEPATKPPVQIRRPPSGAPQ